MAVKIIKTVNPPSPSFDSSIYDAFQLFEKKTYDSNELQRENPLFVRQSSFLLQRSTFAFFFEKYIMQRPPVVLVRDTHARTNECGGATLFARYRLESAHISAAAVPFQPSCCFSNENKKHAATRYNNNNKPDRWPACCLSRNHCVKNTPA